MESAASITDYDPRHQGRALAWSPDGAPPSPSNPIDRRQVVTQSTLCDLDSGAITQVTDPTLGGEHAKFFPCGTKLILCIPYHSAPPPTMGIA
jgi:hypothetical protein